MIIRITHLLHGERIVVSKRESVVPNQAIRPEQKSVACMKDSLNTVSSTSMREWTLVRIACYCKGLGDAHEISSIYRCEFDTDCYNWSYISAVENFSRLVLNKESDITVSKEIHRGGQRCLWRRCMTKLWNRGGWYGKLLRDCSNAVISKPYYSFLIKVSQGLASAQGGEGSTAFGIFSKVVSRVF